jgi:CheY-like chemotaxis protein
MWGMEPILERQATTRPRRILVVEDEVMIRMLIEDMLGELGYTVAAAAGRLDEAMQVAEVADFDLAILDVNLSGQAISPLADALAARGTPFVFVTGYGEGGIPVGYRDRPALKKPFQLESLKNTLQTVFTAA